MMFRGGFYMQHIQTRDFDIGGAGSYAWHSEEEYLVNALMSAAWQHHVSRWTKIRLFILGMLACARLSGRRGA